MNPSLRRHGYEELREDAVGLYENRFFRFRTNETDQDRGKDVGVTDSDTEAIAFPPA